MINGRNDFQHPFETGQIPFYNALGTPRADKDTVILESGHFPPGTSSYDTRLTGWTGILGPVALTRR